MEVRWSTFIQGVKDIFPSVFGVLPFGIVAGISAVNLGVSKIMALAMSVIMFAGTSQLAALELLGQKAPLIIIVITGLIINLRFVMYSASLAPYFKELSISRKGFLAYLLADQAYAVSIISFTRGMYNGTQHYYYLGAAITMWLTWILGTFAGVYLGTQIPSSWSLDFTIPLSFLSLLMPAIKDRPTAIAAISSGGIALMGHNLPFNFGMILAALTGISIGYALDKRSRLATQS